MLHKIIRPSASSRFRGGSGGLLEPPFRPRLFQFEGEINEKSGKTLKMNPLLMYLNPFPDILDPSPSAKLNLNTVLPTLMIHLLYFFILLPKYLPSFCVFVVWSV